MNDVRAVRHIPRQLRGCAIDGVVRPRSWSVVVALVFAIASCGPVSGPPSPSSLGPDAVVLLTADGGGVGCPANVVEGDLVVDDSAGSAIVDSGIHKPIRWPHGYTGRRSGPQVEILDATGTVVARSGTRIRLGGGEVVTGTWFACPGPIVIR